MTVRSTSQLATSPNSKRLHSHTTGRLFALQSRSIFPRPHQSLGSKLQKHKTQHSYEFSSRQKRAASARQHARAPQASPSDASTESGPKVVGLGLACWDFLAQVASFPKPDEKLRTQRMETRGGGNCANALTAASRLGTETYLVTKLGTDSIGDQIASELESDGVNTQFVLREEGLSGFGYMIVDKQGGTRTSILTAGVEYTPKDLQPEIIDQILENASLVYFDGRLTDAATLLAKAARKRGMPVLVEAERQREGLDALLQQADYLCTSTHFPMSYTGQSSLGDALISLLQQLPQVQWVITTLGKKGSVLIERTSPQHAETEAVLEDMLSSMLTEVSSTNSSSSSISSSKDDKHNGHESKRHADCISKSQAEIRAGNTLSSNKAFRLQRSTASGPQQDAAAADLGSSGREDSAVVGQITVASAAVVPQAAIEDTTGAGDSFIGSILYGLTQNMPLDKAMQLGAIVAACNCTALGARPALPHAADINERFLAGADALNKTSLEQISVS